MDYVLTVNRRETETTCLVQVRDGGFKAVSEYTSEQMYRGLVFTNREDAEHIAKHLREQWRRPVRVYQAPQIERLLQKPRPLKTHR